MLFRSVQKSADSLISELRRRKIPFIIGGTVGLFKREEGLAMLKIFLWLSSDGEGSDKDLRSALELWRDVWPVSTKAESRLREVKERLQAGKYKSLLEIFQDIMDVLGVKEIYGYPNSEVLLANLGRFTSVLYDYETSRILGGSYVNWSEEIRGLARYLNEYARTAYGEQTPTEASGIEAVSVMTMHQSKGLEWPVVFIASAGMQNKRKHQENWCNVPRTLFSADRYEGGLIDELRLYYVAMTRARNALIINTCKGEDQGKRDEIIAKLPMNLYRQSLSINVPPEQVRNRPDEMAIYSVGELAWYRRCPMMYKFAYVWGYKAPPDPETGFGNALHFCLKVATAQAKAGKDEAEAVKEAVASHFHMHYAGGQMLEVERKSAEDILSGFIQKEKGLLKNNVEVEYRIEFPEEKASIMGRIDAITAGENSKLNVVDYKTSTKVIMPEEAAFQIRSYALGLKKLGWQISDGAVAYLKEGKIDTVAISEGLTRSAEELRETIKAISSGNFKARPGAYCKNCDFRGICPYAYEG